MATYQAEPNALRQGDCLDATAGLDWKDLLLLADATEHSETHNRFIHDWLGAQIRTGGLQADGQGTEAYQASATVSELIIGRNRAESSLHGRR